MSEHHAAHFHERLDAAMPPEVAANRILLPEEPDAAAVDVFLVDMRRRHWDL